jgi:uncharacterized protein
VRSHGKGLSPVERPLLPLGLEEGFSLVLPFFETAAEGLPAHRRRGVLRFDLLRRIIYPIFMSEEATKPKGRRGFASMDRARQREIAAKGGKSAHAAGRAHQFTAEEAKAAGAKGGSKTSVDRAHMSEIGRRGGSAPKTRRSEGSPAPETPPEQGPPGPS